MTVRDWRGGTLTAALLVVCACSLVVGCDGNDGTDGLPGADSAMLTGRVTSAGDGSPLAGATVSLSPSVPGVTLTVDSNGYYSHEIPVGAYTLTCSAGSDFVDMTESMSMLADVDQTCDFALQPKVPVKVTIADPGLRQPGDAVGLQATVTVFDGSGAPTYVWMQHNSVPVTITDGTTATPTVELPPVAVYRDYLVEHLPMAELDRWQVLAIDPHAYEDAAMVEVECSVTTDSGTYTASVEIEAELAFGAWTLGIDTVPVGVPVLLGGRDQASYDWQLSVPTGSSAVLVDSTTRYPYFTPDVTGDYALTVFDIAENNSYVWTIHVGTYTGMIVGQKAGEPGGPTVPVADSSCTMCHSNRIDAWSRSGHAHIFSTSLDTNDHYGTRCFACHTVGFGTGANGIDDQSDYDDFLAKDYFHHSPGDNWTQMLADEPATARMGNIQCENCHGPQQASSHMQADGSRTSLASSVCGSCHGEPPRHGRYQQWEESKHGNYETAIGEGWDGEGARSCSICHTANGFLYWGENGDWSAFNDDVPSSLIANPGEIHAITCVVCHDPHAVGTSSGQGTDAPMRVEGDTPDLAAGFRMERVGKGAICMICHNGRRGERNDDTWENVKDRDRAPHGGPQTDVLAGENAYFVTVGWREPHSVIADTCVTCHVEKTPPPAELSYNLGGTNHSFEAKESICADCHGDFTGDNMVELMEFGLEQLGEEIAATILGEIDYQVGLQGRWVYLRGYAADGEGQARLTTTITSMGAVAGIELGEWHGRQAMTVHLANGTTVYNVRLASSDTAVFAADSTVVPGTDPSLVDSYGGQLIARCGWNMYLLHSDGSHGIHNPSFAQAVLAATFQKLDELESWYQLQWSMD